jgi:hypothetical protein
MSKHINVNPDHYKVAGRDKLGKVAPADAKAKSSEEDERERWKQKKVRSTK